MKQPMFYAKRKLFLIIFLLIGITNIMAIVPESPDSKWVQSLNGEWQIAMERGDQGITADAIFDNSIDFEWQKVLVPGNWETQGLTEPMYYKPDTDVKGWYKCTFSIPDDWKVTNRQVEIVFEGVSYGYQLWVNGKEVGGFESAFNRSSHNISRMLSKNGENTMVVKVYSSHAHCEFDCSDSWSTSGIFRDVYLCATPLVHFDEMQITTPLKPDGKATVEAILDIYSFKPVNAPLSDLKVNAVLEFNGIIIDSLNKSVIWTHRELFPEKMYLSFPVAQPNLWTAETPHLYNLKLQLFQGDTLLQCVEKQVGIREISIAKNQLLLNGVPIKIRGINRHEMHPERGRALTKEDWIKDIELMKAANINTIRCSHYLPHPGFIELCNKYGMYVIDEVPMGFGNNLLFMPQYLGLLLERVQNTIDRDRNNPSVILWTIGNESPITHNLIKAGEFAKLLDPTRPIGYPGDNMGRAFLNGIPAETDILTKHYPDNKRIVSYANNKDITMPIIHTEYNHALDNALDDMEFRWNVMQNSNNIAGGCVWDWVDQEMLRTVKEGVRVYDSRKDLDVYPSERNTYMVNRWVDDKTILDCHGAYGNDGIVDGYRNPSPSYYEVKKVYAPVKVLEDKTIVNQGEPIKLNIANYYDFTNLDRVRCEYQWISDNKSVKSGTLNLKANPRDTILIEIPITLDENTSGKENYLTIDFFNEKGIHLAKQNIRLLVDKQIGYTALFGKPLGTDIYIGKEKLELPYKTKLTKSTELVIDENGIFSILRKGETIATGPVLHTNRKQDNTDAWFIYNRKRRGMDDIPYILKTNHDNAQLVSCSKAYEGDTKKIILKYSYPIPDNENKIEMDFILDITGSGYIDIHYRLSCNDVNIHFHELGLGLKIPEEFKTASWLGDGPFTSYPGKNASVEYGYYSKPVDARFFEGNYMNINAALLSNKHNSGIALVGNDMNIGFELLDNNILVSHNIYVANRARKNKPSNVTNLKQSKKGSFRLVIFKNGKLPERLKVALPVR